MIDSNQIKVLQEVLNSTIDDIVLDFWEVKENSADMELAQGLKDELLDSICEVCEKFITDNNVANKGWKMAEPCIIPFEKDLSAEECKKAFDYANNRAKEKVDKVEKEKKEAEFKFKNNALNELNNLLKKR